MRPQLYYDVSTNCCKETPALLCVYVSTNCYKDTSAPYLQMGYANLKQKTAGIHLRQFSRAYVIDDGDSRMAFVSADVGMIPHGIRKQVSYPQADNDPLVVRGPLFEKWRVIERLYRRTRKGRVVIESPCRHPLRPSPSLPQEDREHDV
uniref:Neutral/alkaline non-lysosomal ceramidase N-terminal domain-containing protein n=1 Tax=Timema genevievae TaxID=629358 RepID=A0A7R9PNI7_TIMGE|nr:unnamed protein product [Timema genevievae]